MSDWAWMNNRSVIAVKMDWSVFLSILVYSMVGAFLGMPFFGLPGVIFGVIFVSFITIFAWIISLLRELIDVLREKNPTEKTEKEAPNP